MSADGKTGLQLRSLIKKNGELEISLLEVPTPEPSADEVVVRVEAPSMDDLGRLVVSRVQMLAGITKTTTMPVVHL